MDTDKNKVTASATGKLMIMGEHAVLYGSPCIVSPVDQRIFATVQKSDSDADEIETPGESNTDFVSTALTIFRGKYHFTEPLKISTHSDFNSSYGLGSSSAVTVALMKALSEYFQINLSSKELFDLSYATVLQVQKKGSGFDIASAVYEKTLYFEYGGQTIESVNGSGFNRHLIVGYSGVKAKTAPLIEKVAEQMKDPSGKPQKIMKEIAILVDKAHELLRSDSRAELEAGELVEVGKLMTRNHELLTDLEISTERLDSMVEASLKAGALGAKLSGAGGGDNMIALSPADPAQRKNIELAIEQVGGQVLNVHIL